MQEYSLNCVVGKGGGGGGARSLKGGAQGGRDWPVGGRDP